MPALDALIQKRLHSDVALVQQVAHYIVGAGGKRMRPALVLLCAGAVGKSPDDAQALEMAAVVEFIHTATLLHDDVVDESSLRRGRATANAAFGNAASVLVGDFLYSRAFQMMVGTGSIRIMQILADATNVIAEGEVLQLMNMGDAALTQADYMRVIEYKTAKLFEAAAQIPAVLYGCDAATEAALATFGRKVGSAFQIIDDVLDYSSHAADMGKNVGDDLREGKVTLPLIHVLHAGHAAQQQAVRHAITSAAQASDAEFAANLVAVNAAIAQTGALVAATAVAQDLVHEGIAALAVLPESEYKVALIQMAHMAIARTA